MPGSIGRAALGTRIHQAKKLLERLTGRAFGVDWKRQRERMVEAVAGSDANSRRYAHANGSAIADAISGRGPDAAGSRTESGAHAVANIPSVHIPSFVRLSIAGGRKPYKNGYDLGRYRIGALPPGATLSRRERVDRALPLPVGASPENVYFCALELNGVGVRFYGDFSLVLRNKRMRSDTAVLDRNSYDVERSPIVDEITALDEGERDNARRDALKRLSGSWARDLADIAVTKVFHELGGGQRRLTTGQISDALLSDEDYVEVLRIGSFSAFDLAEVRVSASDAALESLVAARLRHGPIPLWAEFVWRQRRRRAERALRTVAVPTHVVVTAGRVKG
jgi:hypothetical protein